MKIQNYLASLVAAFVLALTFGFAGAVEAKASCSVRVEVLDGITLQPMQGITVSYYEDVSPFPGYSTFGVTNNLGQTGIGGFLNNSDYYFRVFDLAQTTYFRTASYSEEKRIACDDDEYFQITFYGYPY